MTKVIFKIPSYDLLAEKVFWSVRDKGEDYRKIIYMDIPQSLVERICKENLSDVTEGLIKEIRKNHDVGRLREFNHKLENYWAPLNDLFFEGLRKVTGFGLEYDEYISYLSTIRRGSYRPPNIVFINPRFYPKDSPMASSYVLAEEILHLHYWSIFRKVVKDVEVPWRLSKEIWEISETIPEYVLTDRAFEKFGWPKDLARNYPFLKKRKEELDPLWNNKKNFKDFVVKIHKGLVQ